MHGTVSFATKPVSVSTGGEACGGDPRPAAALRGHPLGYVPTGLGVFRADRLVTGLPKQAWLRLRCTLRLSTHRRTAGLSAVIDRP